MFSSFVQIVSADSSGYLAFRSGSKAQCKGDARSHVLYDPYVIYVVSGGPIHTKPQTIFVVGSMIFKPEPTTTRQVLGILGKPQAAS